MSQIQTHVCLNHNAVPYVKGHTVAGKSVCFSCIAKTNIYNFCHFFNSLLILSIIAQQAPSKLLFTSSDFLKSIRAVTHLSMPLLLSCLCLTVNLCIFFAYSVFDGRSGYTMYFVISPKIFIIISRMRSTFCLLSARKVFSVHRISVRLSSASLRVKSVTSRLSPIKKSSADIMTARPGLYEDMAHIILRVSSSPSIFFDLRIFITSSSVYRSNFSSITRDLTVARILSVPDAIMI